MKITKAILTGGGRATRLRPITTTINKHLIPLAGKPMIFYAIDKAVEAGIKEIFINTNPGETELQKAVGDGGRWGIKIKFFVQEGGPKGIAHVVNCAKDFIGDDPFMFYLSDNIILGRLAPLFMEFEKNNSVCQLALSKVVDPERFGVPVFDNGELVDTLEKPDEPPNNFAITGIYLFGPKIFFESFNHTKPSERGEYELPVVISYILKHGGKVGWKEVTGWWKDTGKPEDLILANRLLLDQMPAEKFIVQSKNHGAELSGNVHIGNGVKIGAGVKITGPVLVGDNCVLDKCQIGPHVTIGSGANVKGATVKECIIFNGTNINCAIKITDSIIGSNASIINGVEKDFHRLILGDNTFVQI